MKKPVMGIQLYTLRDYIKTAEDFDSTLERLEKAGVRDVQISAIGDIAPEVQREILDKHNMRVCVTHKPLESILGDVDGMIAHHRTIGCDAIGLGWMPENERENRRGLLILLKDSKMRRKNIRKTVFRLTIITTILSSNPLTAGRMLWMLYYRNPIPVFLILFRTLRG